MSSTIYKKAFEVELSHDFYVAANEFLVNRQLELVPTVACADLMRSGRMRFVRTGQGFAVFYQAYLDTVPMVPVEKPLVELTGAKEFLFVVRIRDNEDFLLNVTDLNIYSGMILVKTYGSGMKYVLNGSPASPALAPSLIDQLCPKYLHTISGQH